MPTIEPPLIRAEAPRVEPAQEELNAFLFTPVRPFV